MKPLTTADLKNRKRIANAPQTLLEHRGTAGVETHPYGRRPHPVPVEQVRHKMTDGLVGFLLGIAFVLAMIQI